MVQVTCMLPFTSVSASGEVDPLHCQPGVGVPALGYTCYETKSHCLSTLTCPHMEMDLSLPFHRRLKATLT